AMPAAMAMKNPQTLSTAPKIATMGPPCMTLSATLNKPASAPATAPPTILAGMTCRGRAAASGIAPSVMPKNPINSAAIPESFSALLNHARRMRVATVLLQTGIPDNYLFVSVQRNAGTGSAVFAENASLQQHPNFFQESSFFHKVEIGIPCYP